MDGGSKVQFSDREALLYHSYGRPGKIEIVASKPMATQRDLSLAYSPGVAAGAAVFILAAVRAVADIGPCLVIGGGKARSEGDVIGMTALGVVSGRCLGGDLK